MKSKKPLTLTQEIFISQVKNDFFSGIVTFFYSTVFVFLNIRQLIPAAVSTFTALCFIIFVVYRPLNKKLTLHVSKKIKDFEEGKEFSLSEKSELYKELMSLPFKIVKVQTLLFIITVFSLSLLYYYLPSININLETTVISYLACFFGIYLCSTVCLRTTERICTNHAVKIIEKNVDKNIFKEKKYYGTSLTFKVIIEIIIPVITTNFLCFLVLLQGYAPINYRMISAEFQIFRIIIISFISILITIRVCINFYFTIKSGLSKLKTSAKEILKDSKTENYTPTALSNEIDYNLHLMNQIVKKFRQKVLKASNVSKSILASTETLTAVSSQLSENSTEQNSDVKAMLITMEDTNLLSKNISDKIKSVFESAENTNKEISSTLEFLNLNISQLKNIKFSNEETTKGVKNLYNQIDSIEKNISDIKNISNQTKIVSLNAELEATNAKEEGKNFHIISKELIRLTETNMSLTKDIQTFIDEIKKLTKALIKSSQNESSLIEEEVELSQKLVLHFDSIKDTSSKTFTKANSISKSVENQSISFSQIVTTLKQISSGIENFAASTKNINDIAFKMQELSSELDEL